MTTKPETIRALNDELRQNLTTGTAFLTADRPTAGHMRIGSGLAALS